MPVEDFPPNPPGFSTTTQPRVSGSRRDRLDCEATEEVLHAGLDVDIKSEPDEPEDWWSPPTRARERCIGTV
jgi:hypothetical protein